MKHLHFVGIGGARLSGLAKLYLDRGYTISGSDWQDSSVVRKLAAKGVKVYLGHNPANIQDADLVIYTNAVGNENPEVLEAMKAGIPVMEGAELLGRLMADVGKGIAIAGTHGKTTTSALAALMLTEGGLDPTVLIGGEINAFEGNHRSGVSPYMVVEACEFRRSFLELRPTIELITNIDWDHPDCFPTFGDVIKTFEDFTALLPANGMLFVWGDDPNAYNLRNRFSGKTVAFGYQPHFDWQITDMQPSGRIGISARIHYKGRYQGDLKLAVPGKHNLQNATGALALAAELGVSLESAFRTASEFTGVHRRFEIKGEYNGALVVDDYAHHPNAVRSTLSAARNVYGGRIWCVFQPHLFSRTKFLLGEFAQAFQDADILVLADIYPAREVDPGDISSADLADRARQFNREIQYLGSLNRILDFLSTHVKPGDLVLTMGAGDVWKVGDQLVKASAVTHS